MREGLFSGERKEDGIIFILGSSARDSAVYRWEPLFRGLRRAEAGTLRHGAENRRKILSTAGKAGLLPVMGPLYYREKTWLGWRNRPGENLFPLPGTGIISCPETTAAALPLLRAYAACHQAGLVVGRPQWQRIRRDKNGLFMPDPRYLIHLVPPERLLPNGLAACRPPEVFAGREESPTSDLYYLGLLLYLVFTGHLPYRLENGWPVRALLAGEIIPPVVFRPEIHPLLSKIICALLSPATHERPSAQEAGDLCHRFLERGEYRPAKSVFHRQQLKKYRRQRRRRWGKKAALLLLGLFLLAAGVAGFRNLRRPNHSPVETAEEFYRRLSGPVGAGIPPGYEKEIIGDFLQAQEERILAAQELLTRPLLEVKELKIFRATNDRVVIEAMVDWWEDTRQKERRREFLFLTRNGSRWKVQERRTGKAVTKAGDPYDT